MTNPNGPWRTYSEFRSANRTELPPLWMPEPGTIAKVAMEDWYPGSYFHLAPRELRDQIKQQGLMPNVPDSSKWNYEFNRDAQPSGVYMFKDPENARYWAWENGLQNHDLWEVNTEGLPLHEDTRMAYPSVYHPNAIAPDRLYRWDEDEDDLA